MRCLLHTLPREPRGWWWLRAGLDPVTDHLVAPPTENLAAATAFYVLVPFFVGDQKELWPPLPTASTEIVPRNIRHAGGVRRTLTVTGHILAATEPAALQITAQQMQAPFPGRAIRALVPCIWVPDIRPSWRTRVRKHGRAHKETIPSADQRNLCCTFWPERHEVLNQLITGHRVSFALRRCDTLQVWIDNLPTPPACRTIW